MCKECGCDITNEINDWFEPLSDGKKGNTNRSMLDSEQLQNIVVSVPEKIEKLLD